MTELVKIEGGAESALPVALVEKAADYIREAKSDRTREAYANAWRFFSDWCADHGRCALPASPETVAAWTVALAEGQDGRKPRARNTISQYVAAVVAAQRAAGFEFNRDHAVLKSTLAGVNMVKAETAVVKKARPLLGTDLRDLLEGLREGVLRLPRWGAALSRLAPGYWWRHDRDRDGISCEPWPPRSRR
jgi:hypothetical protein